MTIKKYIDLIAECSIKLDVCSVWNPLWKKCSSVLTMFGTSSCGHSLCETEV